MSESKTKSLFDSLFASIEYGLPNSNTRSGRRELIRLAKVLQELEQQKVIVDYSVADPEDNPPSSEANRLVSPR